MASAKDLRKRISSIRNTQQITRAMKMVSAAKLRRAQEGIVTLRPYAGEVSSVISGLLRTAGQELNHPLLCERAASEPGEKKVLLVVVTSDRGLCGAFNANIIKAAQRYIRTNGSKYAKLDFAFIGKKGYEFFKSKKSGKYYVGQFAGLNFKKAQALADEWIELYHRGEYDEIKLLYNEFKSAISQKIVLEGFLPVRIEDAPVSTATVPTLYEPNIVEILDRLVPRYFSIQVLRALRESLAAEHGARMAAMENATKNAGEMIRKLTLVYNKTRQAGITKELLEITSGTEAQKS